MNRWTLILALLAVTPQVHAAGPSHSRRVQLICHRTANRDMPENTLESLALAARMGCDVVEIDIRTTLDGVLVLSHDGMLERLTDGMGDIEGTSFEELELLDAGGWMGERFAIMRIPRLTDALRVAREHAIRLQLDIKQKGQGPAIYAALKEEGMLERVSFAGEDGAADDLRALYPAGSQQHAVSIGPECTEAEVSAAHAKGNFVVANFSANPHEMDLPAMRAAVAAGVDALAVDYPRLGADAVGRPVEAKLASLAAAASSGDREKRLAAIRELSYYTGFSTQSLFARWLRDPDAQISHAAALALVVARPATPSSVFVDALSSSEVSVRSNAAWALGMMHAPATKEMLPLLTHTDPAELREVLLALGRCPGTVLPAAVLPFFKNPSPTVRAAAALALARHQPQLAAQAIPELLRREEQQSARDYSNWIERGEPRLTQAEIDPIVENYREHMKLIHALEQLAPKSALPVLATEAFRSSKDYSHVTSVLAGYRLWDRIGANPHLAIEALQSSDIEVADRAEWMLVKGGAEVLPAVRDAIHSASPAVLARLIRVLAWQGDGQSLSMLRDLRHSSSASQSDLIDWAIHKIEMLSPNPQPQACGGCTSKLNAADSLGDQE